MSDCIDGQARAGPELTTMALRLRMRDAAASIAATEDWVATTLERLACGRPHDAEQLRARAARARDVATQQRARAAQYSSWPH